MAVVNLVALMDVLGGTAPLDGNVSIRATAYKNRRPAIRQADEDIIFPTPVEIKMSGGLLSSPMELTYLPVGYYWFFEIEPERGYFSANVVLPGGDGPFDFDELIVVDPTSALPDPGSSAVSALLVQLDGEASRAEFARDTTITVYMATEQIKNIAVQQVSLAAAQVALAEASAELALARANLAGLAAGESELSATESDQSRQISGTSASTASQAAINAEAARAAAQLILTNMWDTRNTPNGFAGLNPAGKIDVSALPSGALFNKGVYNASTNSPVLTNASGQNGWLYVVTGVGSRNFGSGALDLNPGDQLIHDGTAYQKIDNTDAVLSVFGRTGAVVGTKSDVGLSNVDNTSDVDKPVSTATQTALNTTVNGATVVGDNLILQQIGGGTKDAGSVRGAVGPQGPTGDIAPTNSGSATGTIAISIGMLPSTRTYTLQSNVTVTLPTGVPTTISGTITLVLIQNSTGSWTVTWPANLRWAEGIKWQPSLAPGSISSVHIMWTGTYYLAMVAGSNFA